MNKLILAATATAGLAALAAPPALAETRTLSLDPFSAISIETGLTAVVVTGDPQNVTIEAENSRILNEIEVRVENGRLHATSSGMLVLDSVIAALAA